MLLRCCIIHGSIIVMRHFLYIFVYGHKLFWVYLWPDLDLGLFVSYLCDLLFILIFIFVVINRIITRLIVISIAPLTELFCNCRLTDLLLPAVKRYQFQYKVFVGLLWLTSKNKVGSGDFWDKSPSQLLKILKLPSFHSGKFKIFGNAFERFIPNHPPKHMITSTNLMNTQILVLLHIF